MHVEALTQKMVKIKRPGLEKANLCIHLSNIYYISGIVLNPKIKIVDMT